MDRGNEYSLLIRKLDEFIRKYYKNRLLKGGILSAGSLLLAFILVASLEYFGHFSSLTRSILFYGFLGFSAFLLGRWVLLPSIKLFRLGPTIDHKEASRIIGEHFPDVRDKLLNTLELQEQAEKGEIQSGASEALIRASVDQRIRELKPVPFSSAIDLTANRRYLKYALPPFLLLLTLIFAAPSVLTDSTQRIVRHSSHFEPDAPFEFEIANDSLEVVEKEDFRLDVNIKGEETPDKAYIEREGKRFKLKKEGKGEFFYEFKNVNQEIPFRLSASGFHSSPYRLKTLPDPDLVDFRVVAEPPDYTGMETIERNNSGDIRVPEGSRIEWNFQTRNTEELQLKLGDETFQPEKRGEERYRFIQEVFEDHPYSIHPRNELVRDQEGIRYRIRVDKDRYPEIEVEEKEDSLTEKQRYFRGRIEDDHGFSDLRFRYRLIGKEDEKRGDKEEAFQEEALSAPSDKRNAEFYHSWSLAELGVQAGDRVEYHFIVTDNDAVNGPKSTRSRTKVYRAPTKEELREEEVRTEKEIEEELEKGIEESKELKKQMEEVQKDLLNKKDPGWKERKKIEDALEQQKSLKERMERIQKQNKQMDRKSSEFREEEERIKKKQEKLQELFEEAMSEEMKELLEELSEKLEELDKEELQKKMEEMELSNEDLEKRLDRNLEMFKQLDFEKDLQRSIERMEEMKEEQEKLAEESEENEESMDEEELEDMEEKQDSLNKAFEEARDQLDSLRKKDEELENPNGMEDTEPQEEEIQEKMENSSDELQKGDKDGASEEQKDASQKMDELQQGLMNMQSQMEQQTLEMKMKDLRMLLDNVVELSFDQEELIDRVKAADSEDPAYTDLGREQKRLLDDFGKVKDSLYELSKQVFQLKSTIDREVQNTERSMRKSIDQLSDRNPGKAASRQQYAMTALNELALLLDESLQAIQQQLAMQMPGQGNCQKPGGGGQSPMPSLSQLRKMQEKMNQKLKEKQGQGEKGKKGGEGEEGEGKKGKGGKGKGGKGGDGGESEEIAKLAREQEQLRRKLQELSQKIDPEGKGLGNELQRIAEEMEESEKDIVEKKFDEELLERQKEIETRLLESEEAERERGQKKERESESAKNREYSNPEEFFEYKRRKEQEVELLKTVPPTLKPYYKEKVDRYFERYQEKDR